MTVLTRPGLSVLMRDGSQAEHHDAENSEFTTALLAGRINAAGYATYLARLRPVYAALEAIGTKLAGDPIAGEVVDPTIHRLAAIDADLAFWSAGSVPEWDTPAVAAYVATIEATGHDPARYVAHHYTRYLGDLSGGQAIGRVLQRSHGLANGEGVAFYRFESVPKVKPYKDAYRARLDALPLDQADQQRVVAEVRIAFGLNQALFAELSRDLSSYLR